MMKNVYFCSFSSKTIIYKGLMLPIDISSFYIDLKSKNLHHQFVFFIKDFLQIQTQDGIWHNHLDT